MCVYVIYAKQKMKKNKTDEHKWLDNRDMDWLRGDTVFYDRS